MSADVSNEAAAKKIDDVMELRKKLRIGIMDSSVKDFLSMPAVNTAEIAKASKILLYNYQRSRDTDTAMNMAIATAAMIASQNPSNNVRLGNFYADYAIDKTITRLALLEKMKDADASLTDRMAEMMRSNEVLRSKRLLEENALLKKENEEYRRKEAEMEKRVMKKAAELLVGILPFTEATQEKIKERILQ